MQEQAKIELKSRKRTSAILCFFFGYLGIHDFYNKKIKSGIMKLCLLLVFPRIFMHFSVQNAKSELDAPTILVLIDFTLLFLWIVVDFFRIILGKFVSIKSENNKE